MLIWAALKNPNGIKNAVFRRGQMIPRTEEWRWKKNCFKVIQYTEGFNWSTKEKCADVIKETCYNSWYYSK